MKKSYPYFTNLEILFDSLQKFNVQNIVNANQHKWFNTTLTKVNDSVIRLGIVEGEYHWHKHENDDEFFFVISGKLFIDIQDKDTIELNAGEGVTITKGLVHRTRALTKTVMLMVENAGIIPTGDE